MIQAGIPLNVRQVLAELELLSHGSVAAVNASGGGGKPWWQEGSNAVLPPGESFPPHLEYRACYLKAEDDVTRASVLNDAEEELGRRRGHGIDRSRVVEETAAQQDARLLREGRGHPAERVALAFRCTPTRVRRVRLAGGVNADTGEPLPGAVDTEDIATEARRMKNAGMSVRAIALTLRQPKSTIHDLLRAA